MPFPQWLVELTNFIQQATDTQCELNSCNVNRCTDGMQHCGMHSDDEVLFRRPEGEDISSLSIGASRTFLVRKDFTGATRDIIPDDGDILFMKGKVQRFFQHGIPQEPHITGTRINFTWRHIAKHCSACSMKASPAGQQR